MLSDGSNTSTVMAYLTVPQRHLGKDCVNCTPGIIHNKSGGLSKSNTWSAVHQLMVM